MSKKADLSVSLFFPDGSPFTSFDNSTYEIEIVGDVVIVKTKEMIEEYHGFVFVVRKTKQTNEE
jgi:hypothetical protein